MASRSLFVFAALLCICVPPVESSGQTPAPAGHTITVTGLGNASGPVTGAIVMAIAHGPVDRAGLQQALRQAGVTEFVDDRSAFSVLIPSNVGVRGRLPGAAHEDLDAATRAVKAYTSASVLMIRFFGLASDCSPLAPKAREAALTDAEAQGPAIAGSMGARLGTIVSVSERGACPPPGRLGGSRAIDAQTLEMTIAVQETVTYAISAP